MNKITEYFLRSYQLSSFKEKRKAIALMVTSAIFFLTNLVGFIYHNVMINSDYTVVLFELAILTLLAFVIFLVQKGYITLASICFLFFIVLGNLYLITINFAWLLVFFIPMMFFYLYIMKISMLQIVAYGVIVVLDLYYIFANSQIELSQSILAIIYSLLFCVFTAVFIERVEHEVETSQKIIEQSTIDFVLKNNSRRKIDNTNIKEDLSDTISILAISINNILDISKGIDGDSKDRLLKEVMKLIRETVRVDDYILRWDTTQFLVVLHYTPLSNSGIVAEKIRKRVEYYGFLEDKKRITLSISATSNNEGQTVQEAINLAVNGLKQIKPTNKNRVFFA